VFFLGLLLLSVEVAVDSSYEPLVIGLNALDLLGSILPLLLNGVFLVALGLCSHALHVGFVAVSQLLKTLLPVLFLLS
jgi:hypothetical protein